MELEMCCNVYRAFFFSFSSLLPLSSPFVGLAAFKIIISVVKKKNIRKKKTYFRFETNCDVFQALLPPFIVLTTFK